jgi:molybdopterin converting factor small subunit
MKNITVTVNFTGHVDIKNITSGSSMNIQEGTTISELLSMLGIIEGHKKYIIVTVGGRKETLFYVLRDSDEIKLFLPVGGG